MTTSESPAGFVAANVRRLRLRQGWTLGDLSLNLREAGWSLSVQTLSKIETGTRSTSVDDLRYLSVVFGISADELMSPPLPDADSPAASMLLEWRSRAEQLVSAMDRIADTAKAVQSLAWQERSYAAQLAKLETSGEIDGPIDDLVPSEVGPYWRDRSKGFMFGRGEIVDDQVVAFMAHLLGAKVTPEPDGGVNTPGG